MSIGSKSLETLEHKKIKDLLTHECSLNSIPEQKPMTAWDEEDFKICVKGSENIKLLKELYQAFLDLNIIITRLKGGVFTNSSLSILILDKLPTEQLDQLYSVDKKSQDLMEYEAVIGMTELKKFKKR